MTQEQIIELIQKKADYFRKENNPLCYSFENIILQIRNHDLKSELEVTEETASRMDYEGFEEADQIRSELEASFCAITHNIKLPNGYRLIPVVCFVFDLNTLQKK